jgi:mRNA-degrading endonuclease toxin of MazEF toxin-antitoxin module
MQRGEIYWAETTAGRRPVVVLARSELARGQRIFVVPITSQRFHLRAQLPNCVAFRAGEFGLDKDSVAQGEEAGVIEVTDIDAQSGSIGTLSDEFLRDVVRAVGYVMDADCEPL